MHTSKNLCALIIASALLLPTSLSAQSNDSLVVFFFQGVVGEQPIFELPGITPSTMDYNKDGTAELVFFNFNKEDITSGSTYNVYDGVTKDIVFAASLDTLWRVIGSPLEAGDIKTGGFHAWNDGGDVHPVLRVGDGFVIFDPNTANVVQVFHPSEYRLLGLGDIAAGDGVDVIVVNKSLRVLQVFVGAGGG